MTKIAVFGNLCNQGELIARAFPPDVEVVGIATYPPFFGSDIQTVQNRPQGSFIRKMPSLIRENASLIRSDVIVSLTATLMQRGFYFQFVREKLRPYVAVATGSDLRQLALLETRYGYRAARFFQKADLVAYGNYDKATLQAIERLKLQRVFHYPVPLPDESDDTQLDDKERDLIIDTGKFLAGAALAVVMPTYIDFHQARLDPSHRYSKGNDLAYATFLEVCRTYDIRIVLRDEGPDVPLAQAMLQPIAHRVHWIPHLSRPALHKLFRYADVVVDQFGVGAYGLTALEAGSMGIPVIVGLDPHPDPHFDPQFMVANTSEQITDHLVTLLRADKETRRAIGKNTSQWIRRAHGPTAVQTLVQKVLTLASS